MRTASLSIWALGLTVFLSSAALAGAQTTPASHQARPTLSRERNMTQLNTMDLPAASLASRETVGEDGIRPFRAHVSDADLADLRRRLVATRWPDKETVADRSQGAQLANLQELVRYWGTSYDWRKAEAKLNAWPQFVTRIDGVDIHFIHVRSRHPNAMPVIIAHGWPGSVFEQIKLIGPLTDPTAFGGKEEDAYDVVIPSLPGYGFSGRPTETGWGSERIARAFAVLMTRLGYARYVAQGGDWGAGIVQAMGRHAPTGLLGIHTNFPATIPNEVGAALAGGPVPAGLSEQERAVVDALKTYGQKGGMAYVAMMGARPQAVGYGMTDSPAGLAAFMLVHPGFAEWTYGKDPKQSPTRDEVLDDFTLYWLTNSVASSARLYWENRDQNLISAGSQKSAEVLVPVAITVFPEEVYRAPETWARRAFRNVIYFHEVDRGGHFAAWEHPELFAAELRAAFRSLR
jgi:pimeloyl-ACP methyl ester carboxylesterase